MVDFNKTFIYSQTAGPLMFQQTFPETDAAEASPFVAYLLKYRRSAVHTIREFRTSVKFWNLTSNDLTPTKLNSLDDIGSFTPIRGWYEASFTVPAWQKGFYFTETQLDAIERAALQDTLKTNQDWEIQVYESPDADIESIAVNYIQQGAVPLAEKIENVVINGAGSNTLSLANIITDSGPGTVGDIDLSAFEKRYQPWYVKAGGGTGEITLQSGTLIDLTGSATVGCSEALNWVKKICRASKRRGIGVSYDLVLCNMGDYAVFEERKEANTSMYAEIFDIGKTSAEISGQDRFVSLTFAERLGFQVDGKPVYLLPTPAVPSGTMYVLSTKWCGVSILSPDVWRGARLAGADNPKRQAYDKWLQSVVNYRRALKGVNTPLKPMMALRAAPVAATLQTGIVSGDLVEMMVGAALRLKAPAAVSAVYFDPDTA